VSKSVKFYYHYSCIYFIEDNKVCFICEEDDVVHFSSFLPWEVEQFPEFEFIEEVFN